MSNDLASKIAAGEVVTNQASVVKELVENAIDAKASKIDIILVNNGLQLIEVIDNGIGMDKEDLLLATKEHASSKLTSEYDLFKIDALGFRGEALASIKSIAKVTLSSNHENANHENEGYIYDVFNDKLTKGYKNKGSKISVYNIFYNTPARFKYLESFKKELAKIVDIINRYALTYTNIAFSLINDSQVLIQTNGNNNILQVVNSIYSLDVVKGLEKFEASNSDFKINGYISNRETTRSNKNHINIFVNKRLVLNKELINAIIEGYQDYLMERRYPIVFLNIYCDYQLIDVNVHPAKLEVRISKIEELLKLIEDSIKNFFKIKRDEFIQMEKIVQPSLDFTYNVEIEEESNNNEYSNKEELSYISEEITSYSNENFYTSSTSS
jgi:DNA mismatch repair protein MutL